MKTRKVRMNAYRLVFDIYPSTINEYVWLSDDISPDNISREIADEIMDTITEMVSVEMVKAHRIDEDKLIHGAAVRVYTSEHKDVDLSNFIEDDTLLIPTTDSRFPSYRPGISKMGPTQQELEAAGQMRLPLEEPDE